MRWKILPEAVTRWNIMAGTLQDVCSTSRPAQWEYAMDYNASQCYDDKWIDNREPD